MPGHPSNGIIGRHALQHGAWRGHERPPSPRYDPNRRVEACPVITSHALISIMVGSKSGSKQRPDTLMQDRTARSTKPLAPHGRTIHWVRLGKARADCLEIAPERNQQLACDGDDRNPPATALELADTFAKPDTHDQAGGRVFLYLAPDMARLRNLSLKRCAVSEGTTHGAVTESSRSLMISMEIAGIYCS